MRFRVIHTLRDSVKQYYFQGDLVLETLLKMNRPPTDQEKAIVQRSMAPTNEKLKDVRGQISETVAHIEALKSQVQQAEGKLQRLLEDEAAILETSEDHHRVLSAIRILPEDVLREICIACVEAKIPILSYRTTPLPYVLAQISRGMRHIALTTPVIWASMDVQIRQSYHHSGSGLNEQAYIALSRRVTEWFARSGGLPLTLFIKDPGYGVYRRDHLESHPSDILLNTLLSYSACWKSIQFETDEDLSIPILRIFALTADDVPVLQSITLRFESVLPPSVLSNIAFLKLPTLRCVSLKTRHVRQLPVNWSFLTTISLRGGSYHHCYSKHQMAQILRQTKCLVSCYIIVGPPRAEDKIRLDKINLLYLETFHIDERDFASAETEAPSLLDLISAPILVDFRIDATYLEASLLDFVKRSPNISKLRVPYFEKDKSLTFLMALLRYCPSLTFLYLGPAGRDLHPRPADHDGDLFLRSFVEEGDTGVACPRLQRFHMTGRIHFSLETFRLLLERKQRYTTALNILPWKMVFIYIPSMSPTETHRQISDFAKQKRAEGLDVSFFLEGMNTPRY